MADKQRDAALRVNKAGLLTTVQDLGRYGYGRFGLPVAGAVDECALRWANVVAGNPAGAAALEMTLLGPTLTLEGDQAVVAALAGADFGATLNGVALPTWRSFTLHPGDTLALGACRVGARSYLAVAGGIDVPPVFGSRATDILGGIGGVEGRPLTVGDLLPLAPPALGATTAVAVPQDLIPEYSPTIAVRVVLGPQDERFTEDAIAAFLASCFTVTRESDRMGMRLEGPALTFRDGAPGADILSEGVVTGAIQVPAHGKPIVLLAAHQTTGGYAKIATVIGADLWRLGQARPGDTVGFSAVTIPEAHEALAVYHALFDPAVLVPPAEVEALSGGMTAAGTPKAEEGESGMADHDRVAVAPATGWSPAEVNALLDKVASLGLAEVVIETAGLRLELRRDAAPAGAPPMSARAQEMPAQMAATAPDTTFTVTAPFVGVFYHGPRPGEPALVRTGDIVESGQTVGLIEVMKTFHEVTADRRGRVVTILAGDGAPVEFDQPLLTLEEVGGAE